MSFAHIDEKLAGLSTSKAKWAKLGLPAKIELLDAVVNNIKKLGMDGHKKWANDGIRCQLLDPDNKNATFSVSIEMLLNITMLMKHLNRLKDSFTSIVKTGKPLAVPIRTNSTGHTVADVFPQNGSDKQGPTAKWKGELWLNSPSQGGCTAVNPEGGVAVVLGAGNQGFLTSLDIVHCLFHQNEVVLAKHHPLRGYQDGPFRFLFAPLVAAGFLDFLPDEGIAAASHLVQHAAVSHVHMTGGAPTHDAIVWGGPPALRAANKAANTPVLQASMTSELGCITPYVVVPAVWTAEELKHHAQQLATAFAQNVSCNCNAPKVLVLAADWAQKGAFMAALKLHLCSMPLGVPYYPGTQGRYEGFAEAYKGRCSEVESFPNCSIAGSPKELPWLFVEAPHDPVRPNKDEYAFRHEAFGPVLAVCEVKSKGTIAFMQAVVPLCNDVLYGGLSATVVLHPSVEAAHEEEVAELLAGLKYGCIGVNAWTGSCYSIDTAVWGAYPGEELAAVESGRGFVQNTLLFDDVEKAVIRTPFIDSGHIGTTPANADQIFNVCDFVLAPGVWTFAKMLAPGLGRFPALRFLLPAGALASVLYYFLA